MKIVRIIARLNVGGPARHVVWLTQALENDEFSSVLVAGSVPRGEQSMEDFAQEHGVSPVYIREMSRELSLKDAASLWKVFKVLRETRPDIIHTHTAKAGTVGRVAGLLYKVLFNRRVKLVHTYHGHVFHSYYGRFKTGIFLAIEKALALFATDRIVAISESQRREIGGEFGVGRESQFSVIPLGVDLEGLASDDAAAVRFREEVGASEGDVLVGFVGRLTEIKNLPMLIEAVREFLSFDEAAENVRFVIIGDGGLRAELEAYAEECGIASRTVFAGNREDAHSLYAALDVVALTSLNEGTPLSLIEAMASGVPVIATAVGGVPDVLGAKVTGGEGFEVCERGISVRSGDVRGFARGLERMVSDADLRRSLSESGAEFARARYGKDRLVSDIAALYRELHSGRS